MKSAKRCDGMNRRDFLRVDSKDCGQIVGSSDALGEFPKERPVTLSDLSATIYTLLGIDPSFELHTSDGRPVRVAPDGTNVVSELIA